MTWIRKHRPSSATATAIAALLVALGGAAFAAIPDSNGTIHGCYQKNSGYLRVVQSSSECRDSEQTLNWNQQGPPGEASGVTVLKPFSLNLGDRRLLFQAGSVTFTAFCKSGDTPPDDGLMRANVEVTTSQDHAAVMNDGRNANRDLLTGQTWTLFGASAPGQGQDRNIGEVDFMAISPEGTHTTGIISTGVNLGNPGTCQFGGHVAIGK